MEEGTCFEGVTWCCVGVQVVLRCFCCFPSQTMQICGAGPYDQHLMLGEHELTDHSQSLAALGIFPGALLILKVGLTTFYTIHETLAV